MKVLIYGVRGSGKSYLAKELAKVLGQRASLFDVGFLDEYKDKIKESLDRDDVVICASGCPTEQERQVFGPDFEVWLNTVDEDEEDITFEKPAAPDYVIRQFREDYDAREIAWLLLDKEFDSRAPTAALLGTFQPWTEEHDRRCRDALDKTGQVALLVRDQNPSEDYPYHVLDTCQLLRLHLAEHAGKVRIFAAPNIEYIDED